MPYGRMREVLDGFRIQVDPTTAKGFEGLHPHSIALDDAAERIRSSKTLTHQGQVEALVTERQAFDVSQSAWDAANITALDKIIAEAQGLVDRAAKKALPPDPTDQWGFKAALNEAERQSRYREIRAGLWDVRAERIEELARMTRDDEFLEAVFTGPARVVKDGDSLTVEPMVRPEVIAEIKMARAALVAPDEVERLKILVRMRDKLAHWSIFLRSVALQIAPLALKEQKFLVNGVPVAVPEMRTL